MEGGEGSRKAEGSRTSALKRASLLRRTERKGLRLCMSPLPLPPSGRLLPSPPCSFSTRLPAGFFPTERELVFDIDLTDYDDVRTCGKEGHICCKCWPLMAVAVEVCVWGEGGDVSRGGRKEDPGSRGMYHKAWPNCQVSVPPTR